MLTSMRSGDSSVGITTGRKLDDRGSIPGSARFFSSPQHSASSLLSNGYRGGAISHGVKWPEREADSSPPASAEVKNCGTIRSLPHMP
jgi:hypothetical protein